mgnify:CR=1 FL=1
MKNNLKRILNRRLGVMPLQIDQFLLRRLPGPLLLLIKKSPLYSAIKLWRKFGGRQVTEGTTKLNILKTFPQFETHGWGLYDIRAKLTIQSINQVIPALNAFCEKNNRNEFFEKEVESFFAEMSSEKEMLAELFNKYGSDKASAHNYFELYASILNSTDRVTKIFEIGLGTNNLDVVSTMGTSGKPGASLRAFRDYAEQAQVFGADFDKRVLFEEDRIKTFFVDQTDVATFDDLSSAIGDGFDLMIDDGLHSPNANLHSLKFFLPRLKVGGYAVVEDIDPEKENMWAIVTSLLPNNYHASFIRTKASNVYVVKRLS